VGQVLSKRFVKKRQMKVADSAAGGQIDDHDSIRANNLGDPDLAARGQVDDVKSSQTEHSARPLRRLAEVERQAVASGHRLELRRNMNNRPFTSPIYQALRTFARPGSVNLNMEPTPSFFRLHSLRRHIAYLRPLRRVARRALREPRAPRPIGLKESAPHGVAPKLGVDTIDRGH
jgi:hypothetical protein